MKQEYIQRIYAGWLAKIIGIRLGAPVESWTHERILQVFGELEDYPVDYREFAADDDSNGPLFFLRALEDSGHGENLTAQDVAEALLNYAPYEHGFFWWGGYGISTEHTAYLNLVSGIPAPRSGSIEQNGYATAEQIGGQIFIDTWGLVAPGNPDLAVRLARQAASVTHDGNGVYGGMFVAACISYAFEEWDINAIIEKGLSYLPADCEYVRVVRSVMDFHAKNPGDWKACFRYLYENFGYDKYPGTCHIIPNTGVMILALLYGEGDFARTLIICNLCGWDTDCNVGNIATIMGVRCGLEAIDYEKWRKPINDLLVCSSVVGSLNIMDIPYGATYITKQAYALSGEEMPELWREIAEERIDSCHFEYPGSTHAIRVRSDNHTLESFIRNTDETAHTGQRSLKVFAKSFGYGEPMYIYKKTYYQPEDFHDSRYDPCFSPLLYPGQTLHGSICVPETSVDLKVSLYARDYRTGEIYKSDGISVKKGKWTTLEYTIPNLEGALLDEMGFDIRVAEYGFDSHEVLVYIDDLYADGNASYTIDFAKEQEEVWYVFHREISQFTRHKGKLYLWDGKLHLSSQTDGAAYTGRYDWADYGAEFTLEPVVGECHMVQFRVQGAARSYAIALSENNTVKLLKNTRGFMELASVPCDWKCGEEVRVKVVVRENQIQATVITSRGNTELMYTDSDCPYLTGSIGVGVDGGSHCSYSQIKVFDRNALV